MGVGLGVVVKEGLVKEGEGELSLFWYKGEDTSKSK